MQSYLVHALPKLGIFVRHEHNADALVLGRPGASAILGSIDASGRDGHIHALAVRRIEHDGVQSESAISGHPAGTMRMIEQPSHERPGFTRVAGFEMRRRLYAAVAHVLFVRMYKCDLPDRFQ